MIKRMNVEIHRPEGYKESEVKQLFVIGNKLFRVLRNVQRKFIHDSLRLPKKQLEELCITIVEFAEDQLNNTGIWHALETCNQHYFNTPLPYSLPHGQSMPEDRVNIYRMQYLLWHKYQELCPELLLSPKHQDMLLAADEICRFFTDEICSEFPGHSSLVDFFDLPNQYGWDVKKKLLWLGRHSYMFRHSFEEHMRANTSQKKIQAMDDFFCQHTTQWSGLRVIDILAALLDIPEENREELRSWYLRHYAYYQVESIEEFGMIARNIICDKPYVIRVGDEKRLFKAGAIYVGSLVPWNREWYWSGEQLGFGYLPQDELDDIRNKFLIQAPRIAYRYCDDLLQKALQSIQRHYHQFVQFHGDDFVVFPDGYTMAAAIQKQHRLEYEQHPKEMIEKMKKEHNLKHSSPAYNYPQEVLESEDGIGVFFNPAEGQEIMLNFNRILSGIKKNGMDVTVEEQEAIRGFIQSEAISPEFVVKVTEPYGVKSIMESYFIRGFDEIESLQFILRKYKGHGFSQRYPNISLI